LTSALRTAHKEDIAAAKAWIQTHHHEPFPSSHSSDEDGEEMDSSEANELPKWTLQDALKSGKSCLLVIDGYVVDASSYMSEHVRIVIFLIRALSHIPNYSLEELYFSRNTRFPKRMLIKMRSGRVLLGHSRVA
jgi:hypothetical protein